MVEDEEEEVVGKNDNDDDDDGDDDDGAQKQACKQNVLATVENGKRKSDFLLCYRQNECVV